VKKGIKKPRNQNNQEISLDKTLNPSTNPSANTNPLVKILFSYKLSNLQYKDKVRFYYALKGRDGKSGIIQKTQATQLAKTVLLVPLKHDQEFQDFFALWNIQFKRIKVRIENE